MTLILTLGLIGLVFTPIGVFSLVASKRAERLRLHGIQGRGRIVAIHPTSITVNDVPLVRIELAIELPGRPPYSAESRMVLHPALAPRMAHGNVVPVRVDPKADRRFLIELE